MRAILWVLGCLGSHVASIALVACQPFASSITTRCECHHKSPERNIMHRNLMYGMAARGAPSSFPAAAPARHGCCAARAGRCSSFLSRRRIGKLALLCNKASPDAQLIHVLARLPLPLHYSRLQYPLLRVVRRRRSGPGRLPGRGASLPARMPRHRLLHCCAQPSHHQ